MVSKMEEFYFKVNGNVGELLLVIVGDIDGFYLGHTYGVIDMLTGAIKHCADDDTSTRFEDLCKRGRNDYLATL